MPMNMSCPNCNLEYDLSVYEAGQRCRCQCGQVIVVPDEMPTFRAARSLHCSNCGGALEKGRPDCSFCGAMIDLTDTRLTTYCSSCLSMSKEGARFCSECSKPIGGLPEKPQETGELCPRCVVKMRRRVVGDHQPLECPICCGLFVDATDLDTMISDQEKNVGASEGLAGEQPVKAELDRQKVVYVKCPVCDKIMNRLNYGRLSGVIIDYCRDHGYWLDAGELEKIAKWVATGGLVKKRQQEIDDLKQQKARLSSSAIASGGFYSGGDGEMREDTYLAAGAGLGLMKIITSLFD